MVFWHYENEKQLQALQIANETGSTNTSANNSFITRRQTVSAAPLPSLLLKDAAWNRKQFALRPGTETGCARVFGGKPSSPPGYLLAKSNRAALERTQHVPRGLCRETLAAPSLPALSSAKCKATVAQAEQELLALKAGEAGGVATGLGEVALCRKQGHPCTHSKCNRKTRVRGSALGRKRCVSTWMLRGNHLHCRP